MRSRLARFFLGAALAALALPPAQAQSFATRPVRIVVPFAAGGVVDLMARLIAPRMGAELGQTLVIDNRPGAGATLGADFVAKAAPDGHTVLLGTIVTHATAPHMGKLPYNAERDFAPVGFHGFNAAWLLVTPGLPIRSFAEFVEYARRNPGKLNYGTPSIGSSSHLAAELLKQTLNLDYQHVPYKGSAPALQDLVGGQVQFMFDNIGSSTPLVKAGKLRALAVTAGRRVASAPEVPTVAESGVPGFEVIGWAAMFAPAGTPPAAVNQLNRALNLALAEPDVRQKLADAGIETRPGSPDDLARFVQAESDKWAQVIRKGNIRAD
ncbi:MAG: tripartite tricarboxylate transporter substrate binding protein [Burkholderiales bacterium]|nr:tripartite tricarboxylate transporter substrate binding protein [Burkholderiales bacterium]